MATSSSNARKRQALEQPAAADNSARPKRKPSKFKRLLRIVLLVLIIIAASVGATLYYTWPAGASLFSFIPQSKAIDTEPSDTVAPEPQKESAPALPPEKPIFVRLDPFTVTISEGGSRSRILHVAITLRVADEKSSALIGEYMPMVRDQVLQILSAQHPQYIQTPEGREQLVASLKHAMSQPYDAKSSGPDITHVLFTAFVIQ
ncbi:flagellar basal body-associated protein FliL [Paenalcaligenes hominis]|uniref:flagellar basal body-associated FliL family protein n=1 Tax=Paenalcaligenes hominis TaxID=643674 RepID=UPI0035263BC6